MLNRRLKWFVSVYEVQYEPEPTQYQIAKQKMTIRYGDQDIVPVQPRFLKWFICVALCRSAVHRNRRGRRYNVCS